MSTLPRPAQPQPASPEAEADLARLRAYLRTQGYAPVTVGKTCEAYKHLLERSRLGLPLTKAVRYPAQRIWRWGGGPSGLRIWLDVRLTPEDKAPRAAPKEHRSKLEAFDADEWARLTGAVAASEDARAVVLKLAMRTLLRVGQILDTPLDSLRGVAAKDEVLTSTLVSIQKGRHETLGAYIASSPRAAYVSMNRFIIELRARLDLDFDFNTIYRTPLSIRFQKGPL